MARPQNWDNNVKYHQKIIATLEAWLESEPGKEAPFDVMYAVREEIKRNQQQVEFWQTGIEQLTNHIDELKEMFPNRQ